MKIKRRSVLLAIAKSLAISPAIPTAKLLRRSPLKINTNKKLNSKWIGGVFTPNGFMYALPDEGSVRVVNAQPSLDWKSGFEGLD
jgi:hypothetical protein